MIRKIISGGQSGADIGGLIWAKANGRETGGFIPKTFRTENGNKPEYAEMYNLVETQDTGYNLRTRMNVMTSDGTLIFGNEHSPGCSLTKKYCIDYKKPFVIVEWRSNYPKIGTTPKYTNEWIIKNNILVLNIAGNRESSNPGIQDALIAFLNLIME
jgi:hypothetical protein